MPSHLITLYDIQCKLDSTAWSPHTWRTRIILNYKKLPYQTTWMPLPDVQTVLPAVGVLPTRTAVPHYTVPAIVDELEGSPAVVMSDSGLIADYLERTYPEPSIYHGAKALQMEHVGAVSQHVLSRMGFMVFPNTPRLLEGREREYYLNTRKGIFGVELDDMFPEERQEEMWANLKEGFAALGAYIDGIEHSEQWFFSKTSEPGYADFVLGATMIWFKLSGPEKGWERISEWDGGKWARFFRNLEPYTASSVIDSSS
ncbi:predicted protein [Postia placenta Mad-698-R]|nr:predicted protein [Postia placenta Mad-698-R]